jgi:hypothetical protein
MSVFALSVTLHQRPTLASIYLPLVAVAPTGNALQKIGEKSINYKHTTKLTERYGDILEDKLIKKQS